MEQLSGNEIGSKSEENERHIEYGVRSVDENENKSEGED